MPDGHFEANDIRAMLKFFLYNIKYINMSYMLHIL